jgi:hypothetical protein
VIQNIGFTTIGDVHAARRAIVDILRPNAYPYVDGEPQAVRLQYTGSGETRQIDVHYEDGLQLGISGSFPCWERVSFRFLADDPYWYDDHETAKTLDVQDTPTIRYIAGKTRIEHQWEDLGLAANPTTGGRVFALHYSESSGLLYVGGDFTGFNGQAGWNYGVIYDPDTDTWSRWGGSSDFNGAIYDLTEGPDGTIYACGTFTNVDGIAAADYIVAWDQTAGTFSALGTPVAGGAAITAAYCMCWHPTSGNLYVGGDFTDWAGGANNDYIAVWTGSGWTSEGGGGGTGYVNDIEITPWDNRLYVAGGFTSWAATGSLNYLVCRAGAGSGSGGWGWVVDLDSASAPSSICRALAIHPTDRKVVIGGDFTNHWGVSAADYVSIYDDDQETIEALDYSKVLNNDVYNLHFAPDRTLWLTGIFFDAGSLDDIHGIVRWDGYEFSPVDLDPVSTPYLPDAITTCRPDPVTGVYEVYCGLNNTGACAVGGVVEINYAGSAPAYPTIHIRRNTTAGTQASIRSLINESFNYELRTYYNLAGVETITIETMPGEKGMFSSFFGRRDEYLFFVSDLGEFRLDPGDNYLSVFLDMAGTSVTAWAVWRNRHAGVD